MGTKKPPQGWLEKKSFLNLELFIVYTTYLTESYAIKFRALFPIKYVADSINYRIRTLNGSKVELITDIEEFKKSRFLLLLLKKDKKFITLQKAS